MVECETDGSPEFPHTNGDIRPGLSHDEPGPQGDYEHQIFAVGEHFPAFFRQFEGGEFAHNAIGQPSRADPAAECAAEKDGDDEPYPPESPEKAGDTTRTGDDGTVAAAHEGDDKRTAEQAVHAPFSQKEQRAPENDPVHDPQYTGTTFGKSVFRRHLSPPAFPQVLVPWERTQG